MKLTELKKGEKGVITRINGQGMLRKRLSEMGFIKADIASLIEITKKELPL